MKQSRFTEERIIAILREHEAGSKHQTIQSLNDRRWMFGSFR
jgi:hypothetical protein